MVAPFDKRQTDYIVVAISVIPILAQNFIGKIGIIGLCVNWLAAGLFSVIISNIIEQNRLGLFDRNHSVAISWSLISMVLNFSLINFNEYYESQTVELWLNVNKAEWLYLLQMLGFLLILFTVMQTWQKKIATIQYLICGFIIGIVSTFLDYSLLWLLFFPVILYQMRTWSNQNWGSLISGLILSIWTCYVCRMFLLGVDNADNFILSYATIIDRLMPTRINYTLWEWVFIAFIALLLIIYSILGYAINVAKTVKASASVTMLSTLCLIITIIATIDIYHLQNYLGMLSIFMSLQISIHQSCLLNIKNEWWTIIIVALLAILSIASLFPLPFNDILL